jgi:hypothetical protein
LKEAFIFSPTKSNSSVRPERLLQNYGFKGLKTEISQISTEVKLVPVHHYLKDMTAQQRHNEKGRAMQNTLLELGTTRKGKEETPEKVMKSGLWGSEELPNVFPFLEEKLHCFTEGALLSLS